MTLSEFSSLLCGYSIEGISFLHRKNPFGGRLSVIQMSSVRNQKWLFYSHCANILAGLILAIFTRENPKLCTTISVFVDDVFAFNFDESAADESFQAFQDFLVDLGVIVITSKTVPPTKEGKILGLSVNTDAQTLSLPAKKTTKLLKKIKIALKTPTFSLNDIQKLGSSLQYASFVIPGFPPYLEAVWHALRCAYWRSANQVKGPNFHSGKRFRNSLKWFQGRLSDSPSPSLFCGPSPLETVKIATDASGFGLGGVSSSGFYFKCTWDDVYQHPDLAFGFPDIHSNLKELVTAVAFTNFCAVNSPDQKLVNVHVLTDNSTTNFSLRRYRCKNPIANSWLKTLHCETSSVSAEHSPGIKNIIADALSRPNSSWLEYAYCVATIS